MNGGFRIFKGFGQLEMVPAGADSGFRVPGFDGVQNRNADTGFRIPGRMSLNGGDNGGGFRVPGGDNQNQDNGFRMPGGDRRVAARPAVRVDRRIIVAEDGTQTVEESETPMSTSLSGSIKGGVVSALTEGIDLKSIPDNAGTLAAKKAASAIGKVASFGGSILNGASHVGRLALEEGIFQQHKKGNPVPLLGYTGRTGKDASIGGLLGAVLAERAINGVIGLARTVRSTMADNRQRKADEKADKREQARQEADSKTINR